MLSLVNEIAELGVLDQNTTTLNLAPVDIEMLCQQAINTLKEAAHRRDQDIRLSVEPGRNRIWSLDKDKIRQMLYHLIFSVIQLSATGSVVRIHVSYKENMLLVSVWVSHPWLGDGITDIDPYFHGNITPRLSLRDNISNYNSPLENNELVHTVPVAVDKSKDLDVLAVDSSTNSTKQSSNPSRESLGLLLSCQLAELHGGQITIQGSSESGYRYVASLPLHLDTPTAMSDV